MTCFAVRHGISTGRLVLCDSSRYERAVAPATQDKKQGIKDMTIVKNGAIITLTKNKKNVLIRDKKGEFVGFVEIHEFLQEWKSAQVTGTLNVPLYEVQNHFLNGEGKIYRQKLKGAQPH